MTAKEWAEGYDSVDLSVRLRSGSRVGVTTKAWPLGGTLGDVRDLHALGALCLYGQPFGFTREHLRTLRAFADHWDVNMKSRPLSEIADRIEALLPPANDDVYPDDHPRESP